MQETIFPGLLFWRYVNLTLYGSYGVLEGRYKNTCCNYGKIRSYAAANTFYPSKNIYYLAPAPASLNP